MVNPFKEFFAPRSVVGLEIGKDYIGAVRVSNASNMPEVDHAVIKNIGPQDDLGHSLKELFRDEKLKADKLVTAIPSASSTIREISPPFNNPKKLNKIIKYQMEPYVPYPIESAVVDFLPSDQEVHVLAIGLQKSVLEDHLKTLSKINLEPEIVTLEDVALFFLFSHLTPEDQSHSVFIIRLDIGKITFLAIHGKRLDFFRALQSGVAWTDQLIESIKLYRFKNHDAEIEEILLTGSVALNEGMEDRISKLTGIKTTLWRPFDYMKPGLGKIETNLQARLSVPLGLAVSEANGSGKGFNLRKEEYAIKTTADLKGSFIYLLSILLILIGLSTFSVYQKLYYEDKKHKALSNEIRKTFLETFPDTKLIVKGRELIQMKQKIDEQTSQYQWLDEISSGMPVLDTLLNLTKTISLSSEARVDNLSIDGSRIHLDGRASSFKEVDALKRQLERMNLFQAVKLVGAKMDNREKVVKFNFTLEKKL